ncbi:MAG: FIST C-terminal domain-containing protein [Eubacterium sp.]|nr:FIST C-terminal domain-containing protein [Eubacterium sp.]
MQITIGQSQKKSAKDAVLEATAKISSPVGIYFQSSYALLEEISARLAEKYPNIPMIGTSATSYVGKTVSDQILVVVAFGQGAEIKSGVLRHLSTTPLYDIEGLEQAITQLNASADNSVCLEYCTNDEECLVTSMNVALEKKNITLAGGTVFGVPNGKTAYVCVDGALYEDACAWMVVKNKNGRIRTYSENIYAVPQDAKRHVATEVNTAKRELIALDHQSASSVYAQETGVSGQAIVDNALQNPLGRIVGDDTYIISPYELGSGGSLISYKRVNENDTIAILELLDYDQINEQTREKIKEEGKPSFIFSINCIYRHILFNNEHYMDRFLSNMEDVAPHVGVVGGGEQYKLQHVNQTMVAVVFE